MTRSKSILMILAVAAVLLPAGAALAEDPARVFLDGVKRYENGDFAAAAGAFVSLAEKGIVNGQLYYNIGNACFKAGEIGRAIRWYEKARRLIPNDPDLEFNLKHARSFVKDRAPRKNPLARVLFFWRFCLPQNTLVCLAAGCSFVFCLGLFLRRKQVIKTLAFLLYAVLTLGLVFTATAGYNYYTGYAVDRGVILPEKVSVTAGLSDLSTELFVLHAGSRVEIEKQQKNFYRIRFGDKIGWVKQKAVGLI